jgi:hypothetical protein
MADRRKSNTSDTMSTNHKIAQDLVVQVSPNATTSPGRIPRPGHHFQLMDGKPLVFNVFFRGVAAWCFFVALGFAPGMACVLNPEASGAGSDGEAEGATPEADANGVEMDAGQDPDDAGQEEITENNGTDGGSISEGDQTDAGAPEEPTWILDSCEPTSAPSPIRRLTRTEYNNVIRDLFDIDFRPADAFVPDEEMHGFDNHASALWVSQILAEQYQDAAELVAATVTDDLDSLLHCQSMSFSEEQCAYAFIQDFGKKAYRRPLTDGEYDRLIVLFDEQRTIDDSIASGVAAVIEALLQSPHFFYRVEFGEASTVVNGAAKLTPLEIASRMSFLLWNSSPDDELFTAVEDGALGTPEGLEFQARRMLDDPRTKDALHNFHGQWLTLDRLTYATKDSEMFPDFSETTKPLLEEEVFRFLESIFDDETASLNDLLLSNQSFVNNALAEHYGLEMDIGNDWVAVDMPAEERAGVLTLGGVMAALSKYNQTSPILRGVFIRENFLCDPPPPPPDDVDITPPEFDPSLSTRDRFAAHTEDPACAGCHNMIDPIGFGFENYDPVGRYRVTEGDGIVIDASGELLYTIDVDGSFLGAVELAHRLSESEQVKDCYVDQWFRFGYGRTVSFEDQCTVDGLREVFQATGGNIDELLVALTQTTAFSHRPLEEATNE